MAEAESVPAAPVDDSGVKPQEGVVAEDGAVADASAAEDSKTDADAQPAAPLSPPAAGPAAGDPTVGAETAGAPSPEEVVDDKPPDGVAEDGAAADDAPTAAGADPRLPSGPPGASLPVSPAAAAGAEDGAAADESAAGIESTVEHVEVPDVQVAVGGEQQLSPEEAQVASLQAKLKEDAERLQQLTDEAQDLAPEAQQSDEVAEDGDPVSPEDAEQQNEERHARELKAQALQEQALQAQVLQEKLQAAMQGVLAEFGGGVDGMAQGELKDVLEDWKGRFEGQVSELQTIVQLKMNQSSPSAASAAPTDVDSRGFAAGDPVELDDDDLERVQSVRYELEAERTGQDVQQVASAWADPEETAKEMTELRRVRRQIRYLFGGAMGSLPDASSAMRVDDLLNGAMSLEELADLERESPTPDVDEQAAVAPEPPVAAERHHPPRLPAGAKPGPREARPRSGGTELSSVTSSVATYDSRATHPDDEDGRRREQRRERRQHRHQGHRSRDGRGGSRSRDAVRDKEPKKEEAPKQWSWADEVVKASLDPQNQWDFPSPSDNKKSPGGGLGQRGHQQPEWEKPRAQRGNDIATKARERAEEVMRSEKDRNPFVFDRGEPAFA